jgi:hypothetical protein
MIPESLMQQDSGPECANSLEQLTVNYAAERMHQLFIDALFRADTYMCQQEDIPSAEITFVDNQVVYDVWIVSLRPCGKSVLWITHAVSLPASLSVTS